MTLFILKLKPTERMAFAIAVAVHALLLMPLTFLSNNNSFRVKLIIERKITHQRKTTHQKKQARQKRRTQYTSLENPYSDYERKMFNRKETATKYTELKTTMTAWGDEKLGKTTKQNSNENIVFQEADSATRWKKGASRRLISLPAIDYPESVRKKSGQGQVELMIEVNEQGSVEEIEIVKSSGYSRLDVNVRNAYRNAVFSAGKRATAVVVVTFRIRE